MSAADWRERPRRANPSKLRAKPGIVEETRALVSGFFVAIFLGMLLWSLLIYVVTR